VKKLDSGGRVEFIVPFSESGHLIYRQAFPVFMRTGLPVYALFSPFLPG